MNVSTSLYGAILTAAMLTVGFAASAADPIVMGDENRTLELGVEYLIPQYKASSGIFTPTESGKLYINGGQDCVPYIDAAHTQLYTTVNLDNTGHMRWMEAEAGKTIYFYASFAMNENIFSLYQEGVVDKPLEVSLMQPEQNQIVDFNNYSDMLVTFNQDIQLAQNNAIISFTNRNTGAEERQTARTSVSGQMLRVSMYSALYPFMQQGAILTGDEYKVIVSGLTTSNGGTYVDADANGDAVFTFLCGSLPVTLQKQYVPDPILSYWPEGAPEGILTMEFDADLMDDGKTTVQLGWGNSEGADGEYYAETIVCKIDGNKLSADLTGKLRTPATMTPAFPNASYSTMSLNVINVRDIHGVPVASEGQGTVGAYSYLPAYSELSRKMVTAEFTPANGSLLGSVSDVNVWISGIDAISFDGFLLTVTDKEGNVADTLIPLKDVTVSNATATEAEYDFTLPAAAREAKSVEITLANVSSLDGFDHSNDVRCIYGGFTVLYSEPASGEEIAALKEDSEILIETNLSDIYPSMYIEYEVIDTDPTNPDPVVKTYTWMSRQADGSYLSIVPLDVKLYAGHEYKAVFTAWENEETRHYDEANILGSDYVIWKGSTPAYRYSTEELLSVTPEPDTVLPADASEIRLEFSGLVTLGRYTGATDDLKTFINLGSGMAMAFKEVIPVDPDMSSGDPQSNIWRLVFPDGFVASLHAPIDISFTATDQTGLLLKGNNGEEEHSCFYYSWNVPGQYKTPVIEAVGESPLKSVKEFTAACEDGILFSWHMSVTDAIVTRNGETVAHVDDYVLPAVDYGETITSLTLVLDTELTEAGEYTLHIPEDYFSLGTEFNTFTSSAVDYTFSIGGTLGVTDITAGGTFTVYSASGILLLENAGADSLSTLAPGLYIVNGQKMIIR